jgi:DNA-binding winged helix-turn-helix (wHTH) protein
MSSESISTRGPELVFGAFRFLSHQRLLYRDITPVRIGSRAREILVVLVERAGEIVRKNELIARVWPHTIVEDGTLRVHIAGLRKALNDGKEGLRFVESVSGIGYRFVAPLAYLHDCADGTGPRVEQLCELQQLREENAGLRRVVADLTREKQILGVRGSLAGRRYVSRRQMPASTQERPGGQDVVQRIQPGSSFEQV